MHASVALQCPLAHINGARLFERRLVFTRRAICTFAVKSRLPELHPDGFTKAPRKTGAAA